MAHLHGISPDVFTAMKIVLLIISRHIINCVREVKQLNVEVLHALSMGHDESFAGQNFIAH